MNIREYYEEAMERIENMSDDEFMEILNKVGLEEFPNKDDYQYKFQKHYHLYHGGNYDQSFEFKFSSLENEVEKFSFKKANYQYNILQGDRVFDGDEVA